MEVPVPDVSGQCELHVPAVLRIQSWTRHSRGAPGLGHGGRRAGSGSQRARGGGWCPTDKQWAPSPVARPGHPPEPPLGPRRAGGSPWPLPASRGSGWGAELPVCPSHAPGLELLLLLEVLGAGSQGRELPGHGGTAAPFVSAASSRVQSRGCCQLALPQRPGSPGADTGGTRPVPGVPLAPGNASLPRAGPPFPLPGFSWP